MATMDALRLLMTIALIVMSVFLGPVLLVLLRAARTGMDQEAGGWPRFRLSSILAAIAVLAIYLAMLRAVSTSD
jgi:hypothetical protein